MPRVGKASKLLLLLMATSMILYLNRKLNLESRPSPSVLQKKKETNLTAPVTIEDIMKTRIAWLNRSCRKLGLDRKMDDELHRPKPWEYLIGKDKKLVWCNVFKSASSSWLYIFNRLSGYSDKFLKKTTRKIPPVTLARKFYPRPSVQELEAALKQDGVVAFLVARHPLERLVSGFRDKILRAYRGSYHDIVCKKILLQYRGLQPKSYRHGKTVPTFSEFVRYVTDLHDQKGEIDMHWAPVYNFCNPCQVNLTYLVKFETFDKDTKFLLEKIGVSSTLMMRRENAAKDGRKSATMVDDYMAELDNDLMHRLVKLYQIDFELFGYTLPAI